MSFWLLRMQPDADRAVRPHRLHWRRLSGEALRFIAAGAANTLATFILYWVLLRFISYSMAYTAAFVAGIVFSYALNALFVFKARPGIRTALAFPLVYLAQYVAGLAILWAWSSPLGMSPAYGVLVVAAITVPMTFLLSRTVFRKCRSRS